MAEGQEQSGTETPALTPAEQTSIEVGQRGFSEPTGVNTPIPSGPQRPDYVPEQFWKDGKVDIEGMSRSYGELRTKLSQPKEEAPAASTETPAAPNGAIKPPAKAEEPTASALTTAMDAARAEFSEKQEVSAETVAALEAAGIPKAIFDVYLEGIRAQTAAALSSIHGFVGGEEAYNAMAQWAASNVPAAEVDSFNAALDDPALRENAVRGLHARYQAARPSEGNLITPNGTAAAGDVYSSRDELIADQRKPEYQTDARFRQTVMEKLQRSQRTGFQAVSRPMFEREIVSR